MNARARSSVAASSRVRLSICTTPVSQATGVSVTPGRAVRATNHGATSERMMTRAPGCRSTNALMTSIDLEAWPKPWPEM